MLKKRGCCCRCLRLGPADGFDLGWGWSDSVPLLARKRESCFCFDGCFNVLWWGKKVSSGVAGGRGGKCVCITRALFYHWHTLAPSLTRSMFPSLTLSLSCSLCLWRMPHSLLLSILHVSSFFSLSLSLSLTIRVPRESFVACTQRRSSWRLRDRLFAPFAAAPIIQLSDQLFKIAIAVESNSRCVVAVNWKLKQGSDAR